MTMKLVSYGFSTPTAEIEQILGLKPDTLARTGLDMDLADHCRMLEDIKAIDLKDETAVREAFKEFSAYGPHSDPRYLDALVRVAKDFFQE